MTWLRWVVLLYGLVNIAGGVMGFVFGNSMMSLVAGGLLGIGLVACGIIAKNKPAMGFRTSGLLVLILMAFWGWQTFKPAETPTAGAATEVAATDEGALSAGRSKSRAQMNFGMAVGMFALLGVGHMVGSKKAKSAAGH